MSWGCRKFYLERRKSKRSQRYGNQNTSPNPFSTVCFRRRCVVRLRSDNQSGRTCRAGVVLPNVRSFRVRFSLGSRCHGRDGNRRRWGSVVSRCSLGRRFHRRHLHGYGNRADCRLWGGHVRHLGKIASVRPSVGRHESAQGRIGACSVKTKSKTVRIGCFIA